MDVHIGWCCKWVLGIALISNDCITFVTSIRRYSCEQYFWPGPLESSWGGIEVQWAMLYWPEGGSLDSMKGGSSDPNSLKNVSGLILRNHVQTFKDLWFQYTITYHKCHITGLDFLFISHLLYGTKKKKQNVKYLLLTTKNLFALLNPVFELKWKNKKMHESCSPVVVIDVINI